LHLAGWGVIQSEAICYARWEESVILKGLLTLLTQRPEFRRLVQQIQQAEGLPALTGITETSRPFVVAALSAALKEPLLLVVADEAQAQQVTDTLKAMALSADDIVFMPDRDALP
jgi:transcription-repair coupling factor (superfamily II helicase)